MSHHRNIALDATYSLGESLSGVGVYSREILRGLAAAHPDQRFLFCYRSHRLPRSCREALPPNAHRALLRSGGLAPWTARLFHGLNQRIDSPFPRSVATFHDLFVLTGAYSTPEFRTRFAQQARAAAERADLLIAVSQFTAGQIASLLKVEPARIRVIHHGVRPPLTPPAPDPQRENIILHVGAIQLRKNISRLIAAFERTPPDWRLVLAGAHGFGAAEILHRIRSSPRQQQIDLPGYVSEPELESLYARARIFAFPSLDEGFGMPVLDAMARGLPVLTSGTSALAEIAGHAALLVEPSDQDSITDGLNLLISKEDLRLEYRELGMKRVSAFSWQGTVEQTWQVYRELL